MKILLIDDSMTMRKIQKRVLVGMGYDNLTEAGNGKEALQQLSANNFDFDLILCDINMPEMNGIETLKRLRANPATQKIPVIMVTSVAEKSQVVEAIKAGATNYLVKPFRPEDLEAKIKQVMPAAG